MIQCHWPEGLEKHEAYVEDLLPLFMISTSTTDTETIDDDTGDAHPKPQTTNRFIKANILALSYGTLLGPMGYVVQSSYRLANHVLGFGHDWRLNVESAVLILRRTCGEALDLVQAGLIGSLFWIAILTCLVIAHAYITRWRGSPQSFSPNHYNSVILLSALMATPLGTLWRQRGLGPASSDPTHNPIATSQFGCLLSSCVDPFYQLRHEVIDALGYSTIGVASLFFLIYFGPAFVIGFRDASSLQSWSKPPEIAVVPLPPTPATPVGPPHNIACPHCASPISIRGGLGRMESLDEVALLLGAEVRHDEDDDDDGSETDRGMPPPVINLNPVPRRPLRREAAQPLWRGNRRRTRPLQRGSSPSCSFRWLSGATLVNSDSEDR